MQGKKILDQTVKLSLLFQIITGIISIFGIFIKVKNKDIILNQILLIETIVQVVEFCFYIYLVNYLSTLNNDVIASRRYIDWVITTPIMLYSTILFMEYENNNKENNNKEDNKEDNKENIVTIDSVNKKYGIDIIIILLCNFFMLFFGFLGETNIFNKNISIPLGFIFFGISFNRIWEVFAKNNLMSRNLFYFLIIVWGLYGVAAMFPVIAKNVIYNCLDIISKNFYGLFILYIIVQKTLLKN